MPQARASHRLFDFGHVRVLPPSLDGRRLHLFQAQAVRGQSLEHPLAAGQDDDLKLGGSTGQDLEHLLDPPIVREHQGVVQDHDRRPTPLRKQLGKREPGEDGDLLAGALAQPIERLGAAAARDGGDPERLVDFEIGAGEQGLEIGADPAHERAEVALLGIALRLLQHAQKEIERFDLALVLGALPLQLVTAAPGARQTLVQAAARERLDARAQALHRELLLVQSAGALLGRPAQIRDPRL